MRIIDIIAKASGKLFEGRDPDYGWVHPEVRLQRYERAVRHHRTTEEFQLRARAGTRIMQGLLPRWAPVKQEEPDVYNVLAWRAINAEREMA